MGKFLQVIFLFGILVSVAFAAPKEESASVEEAKEKSSSSSTTRDVAVVDDTWLTYFTNNSYIIGSVVLGSVLFIGGLGVLSYYVYYVYAAYDAVPVTSNAVYNTSPGQPYGFNGGYQYATGRAMDVSGPNWGMNFVKVLDYIDIARKNYEGFDWQNLDCQKRVLCELSQERSLTGETGRKITNNYLLRFVDVLDGLPIPQIIQAYLAEYKEAITEGKNAKKTCNEIYSHKCKFSLTKLVETMKKESKKE